MAKFTYGDAEIVTDEDTNVAALEAAGWTRVDEPAPAKKSDK